MDDTSIISSLTKIKVHSLKRKAPSSTGSRQKKFKSDDTCSELSMTTSEAYGIKKVTDDFDLDDDQPPTDKPVEFIRLDTSQLDRKNGVLFSEDLNDDFEVWTLQCPDDIDINNLLSQSIGFNNVKKLEMKNTLSDKVDLIPYRCQEGTNITIVTPSERTSNLSLKYSRSERAKRAREQNLITCGEKQLLITNYFEIVDKITNYVKEHNIFIESLEDLQKSMPPWKETPAECMLKKIDTSILLKSLCKAALDNSKSASKNANRYNESLKKFCVFLYFVGGRLLYETLQSNLVNSLPSISSLNRFISLKKDTKVEGEYRFKQLKIKPKQKTVFKDVVPLAGTLIMCNRIKKDKLSNNSLLPVDTIEDATRRRSELMSKITKRLSNKYELNAFMNTDVKQEFKVEKESPRKIKKNKKKLNNK